MTLLLVATMYAALAYEFAVILRNADAPLWQTVLGGALWPLLVVAVAVVVVLEGV